MSMNRPLTKRVDGQWHARILEMPGVKGFMFQWNFGNQKSGLQHGFPTGLTAWPMLGMLMLSADSSGHVWESESLDEVLAELDRMGLGEPPHIDEVFKDTREVFQLLGSVLTGRSLKKEDKDVVFEDALRELREKWQTFVDSAP